MVNRTRTSGIEYIGKIVTNPRKRHVRNLVTVWKELNESEKEAALKKGFDENAGRYMASCGKYLSGTGKTLGVFGRLARMSRIIFILIEGVLGNFMLASAAWISFHQEDMEAMSEALHFFLLVTNVCCILCDFLYKRAKFDRLFTSIGAGFFSYGDLIDPKTKKLMDEHFTEMKIRKNWRIRGFGFLVWSCGFIMFGKVILGYLRFGDRIDGEGDTVLRRQVVPLWFPGVSRWPVYAFVVATCYVTEIWLVLSVNGIILPWIGFVEELTAQLDAIGLGLKRLTARARHVYITRYGNERMDKANYAKCVDDVLKASAMHHITVLEICSDLGTIFSVTTFMMMCNVAMMLCLQGFMLIEKEVPIFAKATSAVFLVTEIFYAYVFCAYSNAMTSASEDIGTQLYLDDWTPISKIVYPYYAFIKLRASKPVQLKAAGFIDINIPAFSNVISSSYSYINLMLSNKK